MAKSTIKEIAKTIISNEQLFQSRQEVPTFAGATFSSAKDGQGNKCLEIRHATGMIRIYDNGGMTECPKGARKSHTIENSEFADSLAGVINDLVSAKLAMGQPQLQLPQCQQ